MPGLGIDIGGTTDVDPMLSFSSKEKSAAEAVIASFMHKPGALWWAPHRGLGGLQQFLHQPTEADEVERLLQTEAEAEERVASAVITVTYPTPKTIQVDGKLTLINNAGDVQFTLTVSEAGEVISATIN